MTGQYIPVVNKGSDRETFKGVSYQLAKSFQIPVNEGNYFEIEMSKYQLIFKDVFEKDNPLIGLEEVFRSKKFDNRDIDQVFFQLEIISSIQFGHIKELTSVQVYEDFQRFLFNKHQSKEQFFSTWKKKREDENSKLVEQLKNIKTDNDKREWITDFYQSYSPLIVGSDLKMLWSFEDLYVDILLWLQDLSSNLPEKYIFNEELFQKLQTVLNKSFYPIYEEWFQYKQSFEKLNNSFEGLKKQDISEFKKLASQLVDDRDKMSDSPMTSFLEVKDQLFQTVNVEVDHLLQKIITMTTYIYGHAFLIYLLDVNRCGKEVVEINGKKAIITFSAKEKAELKHCIETVIAEADLQFVRGDLKVACQKCDLLLEFLENKQLQEFSITAGQSILYTIALKQYQYYTIELNKEVILDELFKKMTYILAEEDVISIGAPSLSKSISIFIHQKIQVKAEEDLVVLLEFIYKILERYDNDELVLGEKSNELEKANRLLFMVAKYLKGKVDHPFIAMCDQGALEEFDLRQSLDNYREDVGIDDFYVYFEGGFLTKIKSYFTTATLGN